MSQYGKYSGAGSGGGGGGTVTTVTASTPVISSGGSTPNISIPAANATTNGYLTNTDWVNFNNKLDSSAGNDITGGDNGTFEDAGIGTLGWDLYNNSGNPAVGFVVAQDITWTATSAPGNGINIQYVYNASFPAATPNINVISGSQVQVRWNNGPTIANNPTATQLKAAWDAVPAALAIATATITGTASNLQYITGSNITHDGGDTAPIDGTGGAVVGETFTRSTVSPLVGVASGLLSKDAVNRQGEGVSTDFLIRPVDQGTLQQINFFYSADAGFTFGSSSDIKVFLYDITNAVLLPLNISTLTGPTANTAYQFVAHFTAASNSLSYRLILHTATTSASVWNLKIDNVVVNSIITGGEVDAETSLSLVLRSQPISGAVNNNLGPMVVMWTDGATQWVPAVNTNTDQSTLFGFAKNIIGLTADIVISGYCTGFSFGPFVGYNQYIDNTAGRISPLPSPFTDTYITVGKAIDAFSLDVKFTQFFSLVNHAKGSLLTSNGANTGNGDTVLAVGGNGTFLMANNAAANGIAWTAPVATAPLTYTASTHVFAIPASTNSVNGYLTSADHTTFASAVTTMAAIGATPNANGASIATATLTLQPASASFGGVVTTGAQTFAGVKTLGAPILTGDVNVSTGNLLVSTIGKGIQVKTGTNAKIGTVALIGGAATVLNTSLTANSRIFVTSNTDGGTPGWLRVSAKTVGTSFVITSSSGTDTSTVAWYIVESIP